MADRHAVGALLIAISVLVSAAFGGDATRPNIVVLYADDMGYGDLGVQNAESKIPTPNLDQLAADGIRFTDAHSSSGICTPSRYALLAGRYHWRKFHGIVQPFGGSRFDEQRVTLPELLKSAGYRTACIGKWHLGWDWEAIVRSDAKPLDSGTPYPHYEAEALDWSRPIPGGPLAHGFDYYFGDDVPNFPPYAWIENDRVLEPPTQEVTPLPRAKEGLAETRRGPSVAGWRLDRVMPTLTDRCVAWIEEQRNAAHPFFLFFPWTAPHTPIVPADGFEQATQIGPYGDFVAQCDATAGRVLEALERNGMRDNTLVIFTSDNGPENYAYQRVVESGHRSMGPLRGLKRDLWEGGHRTPLVIRWPGVVAAATVSEALFSQIDFYATLANAAGVEVPTGMAEDSIDQTPVLRGGDAVRDTLVYNTMPGRYAIRQGDWVLIDTDQPGYNRGRFPAGFPGPDDYAEVGVAATLYDLASDLGQRNNRAPAEPLRIARMKALLEQIRSVPTTD